MAKEKYKVIGMLKSGLYKDYNSGVNVPFMDDLELHSRKVTVENGLLLYRGGALDTTTEPNNVYLFTMDADGNIYAAPEAAVHHHSSFLSGHPVAAAGTVHVNQGNIVRIYDMSGHYMPPIDYSLQMVKELRTRGVTVNDDMKQFSGKSKSALKKIFTVEKYEPRERLYPDHVKQKKY